MEVPEDLYGQIYETATFTKDMPNVLNCYGVEVDEDFYPDMNQFPGGSVSRHALLFYPAFLCADF